jgi:hypothetical protein
MGAGPSRHGHAGTPSWWLPRHALDHVTGDGVTPAPHLQDLPADDQLDVVGQHWLVG